MESHSDAGALVPLGDFLTAEDPVWVWDAAEFRVVWANKAGRDFWGAASLDDLRARRFDPRNKSIRRLADLAGQPGQTREWVEHLTLAAATGRRAVKCYIQSLQIAGGHPGLIVKAIDAVEVSGAAPSRATPSDAAAPSLRDNPASATDRRALEAIAARLQEAAKSVRAHRKTAGTALLGAPPSLPAVNPVTQQIRELCHELRNPLTVILGFAERIRDIAPPGKKQAQLIAYCGDILESARLAMAILGDFSVRVLRPDVDPLPPEPADIRATIESCLRLIAPLARQAGIKVSRRSAGDLPPLSAGERVLKQILLNLLMNAVRHQKTGGRIRVSARLRKDGAVHLAVADDGKGMTKKEIRAVMAAPRSKAPPPPQLKPGSSGIGLPLVKRFVESAGGEFSIDSARGSGTTVGIVFPPVV